MFGIPRRSSPLYATYASLVDKLEQLRTAEALQSPKALFAQEAGSAVQTQPKPKRNAVLGLGLGLILGIGLALLSHLLDTRVRSADDIRERLGLPLLARIPEPPRRLQAGNEVVMLADPDSMHSEAFRMLRTNLEFVNLERRARSIMLTSAVEQEGKSTTAVNLAVAFARAGHRVALVDLDLRRPMLARVFGLEGRPGLTDVVLGDATLERAIASIAVTPRSAGASAGGNGSRHGVAGILEVLPSGRLPPDPGELVASAALDGILASLSDRAELVLIDAPPLLHVGDAMALSAKVDAMVIVARLNVLRQPMLHEVRRLLDSSPATALGFVVTGAELEAGYGVPGYYAYQAAPYESREPVA
ncbi:MAG: P-loop NTPase [Actinobacteria bacterium]|nr:P-loop NTPase [Actinomycetota bacterium]